MPNSLSERVTAVRTVATRLVWLYGLARFVAAAVVVIGLYGLSDYLLRFNDPVARWLLSFLAGISLGWAFYKLVLPALAFRPSAIATARRIEHHFPQLGERLSSAIAFLSEAERDPTAGSANLRRAVIAQAEALSAHSDFRLALDARPTRRA